MSGKPVSKKQVTKKTMVHPLKSSHAGPGAPGEQRSDSPRERAGPAQATPAEKSWSSGTKASTPKAPSTPTRPVRYNPYRKTSTPNSQVHPRITRCKPTGMSPLHTKYALEAASSRILQDPVPVRVLLEELDAKKKMAQCYADGAKRAVSSGQGKIKDLERRLGEAQRNAEVAKSDMHYFGSQVSFFDTMRDNCLEKEIMASIGDVELGSPGGVEKGTGANAPAGGRKEAVAEQQKSGVHGKNYAADFSSLSDIERGGDEGKAVTCASGSKAGKTSKEGAGEGQKPALREAGRRGRQPLAPAEAGPGKPTKKGRRGRQPLAPAKARPGKPGKKGQERNKRRRVCQLAPAENMMAPERAAKKERLAESQGAHAGKITARSFAA